MTDTLFKEILAARCPLNVGVIRRRYQNLAGTMA
jgi:hypothetical protein